MTSDAKVDKMALEMTACRTDKELRVEALEVWKVQQNGELRRIRGRTAAILVSVILLLIGVVANLVIDRSQPDVRAIVEQVIESIDSK